MAGAQILVAVEGDSDAALARRILDHVGLTAVRVEIAGGKGRLDKKLSGYNHGARLAPWFVLRDLNSDAECAPALIATLLPNREPGMSFRLAVRTAETWLMADRKGISSYLGIPFAKTSADPENINNPKQTLVNLARTARKRPIREDMVPEQGTSATVGPGYVSRLIEFASQRWDPDSASKRCDSLRRCLAALKSIS